MKGWQFLLCVTVSALTAVLTYILMKPYVFAWLDSL